jgi:putative chitinase
MNLTAAIVSAGCGAPLPRATQWLAPIQSACDAYEINTSLRVAAFLAEIGVESGRLVYTAELWGPTAAQKAYDPPGQKAAGLGNTDPGDGFLYRGRGLIQVTGKANYAICGLALNLPLTDHPELLQQPDNAALSAAWFWSNNNLNQWADAGTFLAVSRGINLGNPNSSGMPLDYSQRLQLYGDAKQALGIT